MDIMPLMSLQSNKKYPPNPLESRVLHDFPCKKRFKGAKSVVQIKPTVIARCQACCHCEPQGEAIHAGPSPVIASRRRSNPCRSLPRHCEPQGEAIQCIHRRRMDCRGSLRNLAMTAWMRCALDCRGSFGTSQ